MSGLSLEGDVNVTCLCSDALGKKLGWISSSFFFLSCIFLSIQNTTKHVGFISSLNLQINIGNILEVGEGVN